MKIAEIDYQNKSKYYAGDFEFKFSEDSSKFLIYHKLSDNKQQYESFGFNVLNSDFNLMWEKKVTLPYKNKLFELEDFEISNDGTVHILGKQFIGRKTSKRNGNPNFNYNILSYFEEGNQVKEYVVDLEGKFLNEMQIIINESQDVICAGYYSSSSISSVDGSYYLRIDTKTQEVKSKSFHEFSVDILTEGLSARKEKKVRKNESKGVNNELYKYTLDDVILNDDGSTTLIGEQFYKDFGTLHSTTSNTNLVYYYYNDILVVRVTADGVIDKVDKVEKRQKTVNDGGMYSSYSYAKQGSDLYFLFNDNPKNISYDGTAKLHIYNGIKRSQTVIVQVDASGEQERKAVYLSDKSSIDFIPSLSKQINSGDIMIYGKRKKKSQLSKISFK